MDEPTGADATQTAAAPQPAEVPDLAEAMAPLRALFSTLVPPDRITLTDALGNVHSVRAVLPARAQIMIMQRLQRLWEVDVPGLTGMAGGAAGIVGALVTLAADETILAGLCEAFNAAHPRVVQAAHAAAVAEDVQIPTPHDAADLFPVEELVAGLVPFFIRFAARAANLMDQVTAPVTTPVTPEA